MAARSPSVSASGYSTLAPHPGAARKEAMADRERDGPPARPGPAARWTRVAEEHASSAEGARLRHDLLGSQEVCLDSGIADKIRVRIKASVSSAGRAVNPGNM
jgi:hypothetical protein